MSSFTRYGRLRRWLISTAVFGGAALAGLGIVSSADRIVEVSFAQAIDASMTTPSPVAGLPISGSEDYWLSARPGDRFVQLTHASPADWGPSAGDLLSVRMRGRDVALQIVAVERLDPDVTRLDTRPHPGQRLRITARDGSNARSDPVSIVVRLQARNLPREL